MSVHFDGSTLSALIFSFLNGGNQYGFLIGERIEHIEDKISDSHILTYDVNSYIYVSSFVPWPSQECIYNRCGYISDERIQHLISNREQHLVGWYSFRHSTASRPSLREATLHKNLATFEKFGGHPEDFLFFLCTSSSSEDMSTHTCNYGFLHNRDGRDFSRSSGEMNHVTKVIHLATSINRSLMSVHNEIAQSEAALGIVEEDVANLRQQLDLFEQEEMENVFQREEEKRMKEAEEMRKQSAEETQEQEQQLEKLLIDLGMSSKDMHYDASMNGNLKPESLTSENLSKDQSARSVLQVCDPAPLLSKECAFVNSSDRNTNCAIESSSATALAHDRHMAFDQRDFVNGAEDSAYKTRNTQTLKDNNMTDAFSFEEEFRFDRGATARQRVTRVCASKKTDTMIHSPGGGHGLALDANEFSQCKERSSIKDLKNKGTKLRHNIHSSALLKDTSDNASDIPADNDNRELEPSETSQPGLEPCDDKYIVSSSPVF